ncbi:hypothetical protein P691DRAFT_791963 [Macrolepiota fuliginosa MF-IS2]|uniref:ATPase AAA-type core domain-containing protein n=1 Tax=Macrolepiota fuliginosa MF-IS2 TaxID=1400762 RepID=A0A9P5X061_9AGAR|nr:hypothetical protein P691DRAFT_791963 [Macrolepiota fuliginosa MF-IS2]
MQIPAKPYKLNGTVYATHKVDAITIITATTNCTDVGKGMREDWESNWEFSQWELGDDEEPTGWEVWAERWRSRWINLVAYSDHKKLRDAQPSKACAIVGHKWYTAKSLLYFAEAQPSDERGIASLTSRWVDSKTDWKEDPNMTQNSRKAKKRKTEAGLETERTTTIVLPDVSSNSWLECSFTNYRPIPSIKSQPGSIATQSVLETHPQAFVLPISQPSCRHCYQGDDEARQPYLGAFLLRGKHTGSDAITDINSVHQVGVFAQNTSVFAALGQKGDNNAAEHIPLAAAVSMGEVHELQDILKNLVVNGRLRNALLVFKKELISAQLLSKQDICETVALKGWLKGIEQESGVESDGNDGLTEKFKEWVKGLKILKDVKVFDEELVKLRGLGPAVSGAQVTRNHLDRLTRCVARKDQVLKRVRTENPLVLIDEVDKIGHGINGDPAGALLEVLDPEQNNSFVDHYMDIPVDLSRVLFVCRINNLNTIPAPLLDRMKMLEVSGYVIGERAAIALRHLGPQVKGASGLGAADVQTNNGAIDMVIKLHCQESDVKNFKKYIDNIYRRATSKLARPGEEMFPEPTESSAASVSASNASSTTPAVSLPLGEYSTPFSTPFSTSLGRGKLVTTHERQPTAILESYRKDWMYATPPRPGVSTGLGYFWNGSGAIMRVETMVKVHAYEFGIMDNTEGLSSTDRDVYVHAPEGSIGKEGPSAGTVLLTQNHLTFSVINTL